MVTGENVAKQQRHPNRCEGGHAGGHDPHPSPRYALGNVLPQNVQQLADSLLIKAQGLTPPLAKLTVLALFQDQWMPQKLINGILIEEDPLASHPGAFVFNSLLCRPCIVIKLDTILPRKGPVTRAMSKSLQEDWARAAEEGPRVLMNLRVDF